MSNPQSWINDPEDSINSFNALTQLFGNEQQNVLSALNNPGFSQTGVSAPVAPAYVAPQQNASAPESNASASDYEGQIAQLLKAHPDRTRAEAIAFLASRGIKP